MSNIIVIGISGATNSGKSLLAKQLCKVLPSCYSFCQDDYFHLPGHPDLIWVPEVQHQNWERLSALDMGKFASDLQEKINQHKHNTDNANSNGDVQPVIIIVEGFRIFSYKPLSQFFDKKYFLKMTESACWERRRKRDYTPSDPPGYFQKVVWPEYQLHVKEIEEQNDIEYLDGTGVQEEIYQKVLRDIQNM